MRKLVAVAVAMGLALAVSGVARGGTVEESGYMTARDGTRLRYHVIRPAEGTTFPVLVNYEGYAAGTYAGDNGVGTYLDRLLERGFAVVGVSARGTGCSEGVFDPFSLVMGRDGYDAIEWAGTQSWSDGRVGMIGVSFGGITQLLTAAQRPPHLRAIAPSSALSDLYRDVVYPGGILEYDFTFAWTGIQKEGGTQALVQRALPEGDTQCAVNYGTHEAGNANRSYFIPTLVADNPYDDDFDGQWKARSPEAGIPEIDVPAFLFNAWQDEQLPGRIWEDLELFTHPDRLWVNFSNGNHGRDYASAEAQDLTLAFLDHFVRDVDNGFESHAPVSIWMETQIQNGGQENVKTWAIDLPSIPNPTPRAFYLRAGGGLDDAAPVADEATDSYAYPLPSPDVGEPGQQQSGYTMGQFLWKAPVPPGGSVAYTSPPLQSDLVLAGPASLDLWLASTATDTDVQVTVTEVRPDGQEMYVQRGWLRASHRALDTTRSTELRPYQTHLRGDAQPLTAGEPTPLRIEVFPFAHAFRAGSRLRVWIDAPTSHTGFWAFVPTPDPAINTILHDAAHPSRLVVGVLPGQSAQAALSACDTIRNQPCRPDPV